MRINKRNSSRIVGNGVIIDEGWGDFEEPGVPTSMHSVSDRLQRIRQCKQLIHPTTGVVAYGVDIRPVSTHGKPMPNPALRVTLT